MRPLRIFVFWRLRSARRNKYEALPLLKTLPDRETPRDFCFGHCSPATLNKYRAPTLTNPSRQGDPSRFFCSDVSARLLEMNAEIPLLKTLPDRETPRDFVSGLEKVGFRIP